MNALLGASKEFGEGREAVLAVCGLGLRATLARNTRKIGCGKVSTGTCSARKQLLDKTLRWLALITFDDGVLSCNTVQLQRRPLTHGMPTCQGGVVLDAVVDVEIAQVECIVPIVSAQEVRSILGDEEAKTRCEVVRLSDLRVELFERDSAPRVG